MKTTKQIIGIILLLTLLAGMVPTNVLATDTTTSVETGQTTIEGTNSFGTLLSDDIQEQQATEEENYSGGYNVIGLTIENGVATVQYDTLEEAILVVSLYTEDGLQLLVSGKSVVQPEETVAVITLEGEIPEYFMASAYLLDTYDYSPLCASYDTPMYTKEMQELLASTTDDYDVDKVLNLDDDKTTNFAVYADTTKVLEYAEGVNTVVSADDETSTYVIENADENITGLKAGDVLAYAYGENQILIVKVASIALDGTTATITGDNLEMEEVFSHVKVESNGNTEDITVDEATGDDDVTYVGMISDDASVMATRNAYAVNPTGDYTGKLSLGFELEKESGSIKYSGSLLLNLEVDFSYYVSTSRQFVELEIDTETKLAFKISGEAELSKKLPSLNFSPIPAVSVGFKPELVLKFTAEVELSLSVGNKTGFSYENGKGVQDLSTSPKVQMDLDVEGKVFFGLDLGPAVWVLDGHIAEIKFSALAGIELKGEMGGTNFDDFQLVGGKEVKDSIHTCESCLEISLSAKIEFSLKLEFLNLSFLRFDFKLTDKVFDIGEAYYSFDHREFGWGSCPNKSYHVAVYVQNAQGQDAFGVDVVAGWAEKLTEIPLGKTNSNGVVEYYLQAGTYTFMATVDGESLSKEVAVEEACKVTLDKGSIGGTPTFISGYIDPEYVTDNGVVASGTAGYNIVWTLYGSGLLEIHGSGAMSSWHDSKWTKYSNYITNVIIEDGITSIGSCAFAGCQNLYSIQIPDSVTSIGQQAFQGCDKLAEITLPKNLTHIGRLAFSGCGGLTKITIPKSVAKIEFGAFKGCEGLEAIWVDENNDFYSNDSSGALIEKETATLLQLPCGYSGIYHVPDGVKNIGASAFLGCDKLLGINISDTVTTIGSYAFSHCDLLAFVVISESVETINNAAFYYNLDNLEVIVFEGNAPNCTDSILDNVLYATIYYPSENITWTSSVMRSMESPYGSPVKWVAYEPDTNIESLLPDVPSVINNVAPFSAWGGEYETEVTDTYVLKKASFLGLVPDESYVLLALVSIEVDEILAPDNLLYIDQEVATEDGTLVFTYVQRETTDISYVMACGASHNDIKDAVVTFPEMNAGMETQTVDPIVVYDGNTLVEGVDYVVVGTVDYTAAGEYTCYIRGIYNYTGLVECQYTVDEKINLGDFTADGYITNEDVVALLWHTLFPNEYPLPVSGDLNQDGEVNNNDVVLLLWHTLFPEEYPLKFKPILQ